MTNSSGLEVRISSRAATSPALAASQIPAGVASKSGESEFIVSVAFILSSEDSIVHRSKTSSVQKHQTFTLDFLTTAIPGMSNCISFCFTIFILS